MARTIVICGYGPGISTGVAHEFGRQGFQVALVARNAERLDQGVASLAEAGITAKAFVCDLGDVEAVTRLMGEVREGLGPITVIHWNAYAVGAGDLTSCDLSELQTVLDVALNGALAGIRAALPDLRAASDAAVLITGGGMALDAVDGAIVQWNAMGLSLAKVVQHKLAGLLHLKLAADGIYVGEVMVKGAVEGTRFAPKGEGLDPADIAAKFWEIYQARDVPSVGFPSVV